MVANHNPHINKMGPCVILLRYLTEKDLLSNCENLDFQYKAPHNCFVEDSFALIHYLIAKNSGTTLPQLSMMMCLKFCITCHQNRNLNLNHSSTIC